MNKYDDKTPPHQWLWIYSQVIDVAGGTDTTKVAYFLLHLEPTQLLWLDSLPENIVDSWPTLRRLFIDNFQGVMTRAGTRHDLAQCKQNKNESLRDYMTRFFEKCATIANITKADVIDYYYQGLSDRYIFRDFGGQ